MTGKRSIKSFLAGSLLLLHGQASRTPRDNTQELNVLSGSHVIYSYSGTTLPQQLMDLASEGLIGGVILFGNNIDGNTASNMAALQNAYNSSPAPGILQAKTGKSGPLLIMTDQEGGEVKRLPGGPDLSAKDVGAASNPASAGKSAGQSAAAALKAYNNNCNLAPVLGVYRAAGDFLDYYERSYGDSASQVTAAAVPFLEAQQSSGVISTAKHFPGLGAATHEEDTDAAPVTLNLPLDTIRSIDEVPFQAAINAGVDMVMPSWAVYPALDTLPAGLSSKWIQNELRSRMGFTGVTITDTMEGGAIQPYGDRPTRAQLAAGAGMDLLMATGGTPANGEDIRMAIVSGMRSGALNNVQFDDTTERIMTLRAKLA